LKVGWFREVAKIDVLLYLTEKGVIRRRENLERLLANWVFVAEVRSNLREMVVMLKRSKVLLLAVLVVVGLLGLFYVGIAASSESNTLVIASADYAWCFDPVYAGWSDIGRMTMIAYDPLVKYDPETKSVSPWVAKSWAVSKDGLTYTFSLNKGIKFHDGSQLSSSDVKFTVQRLQQLKQGVSLLFESVQTIETPDDYTVNFVLKSPSAEFLLTCTMLYIINEHEVKAHEVEGDLAQEYLQKHELGSGPYKVVLHMLEQKTVCDRFVDYWKGWGGEHKPIDRIIWLWVKQLTTQHMMLNTGQIDISMPSSTSVVDLPVYESDPNYQILSAITPIIGEIDFRVIHKPLDDIRVRKALAMAFDYDAHITVLTEGYGKLAVSPIPSVLPYHNDEIKPMPHDLTAARALLAAAGYPDGGFTLTVAYESLQLEKELMFQNIQENWGEELGIKLVPMGVDWVTQATMQKDPNSKPDIYLRYVWPSLPVAPFTSLKEFYGGEWKGVYENNGSFWSDPKVDQLIEQGLSEQNYANRIELCKEAQVLIAAAVPSIWICEEPYIIVARNYVKGYKYNPAYHQAVDVYHMWLEEKP
jgi:peptide/nickel transport system substrate-binding protein